MGETNGLKRPARPTRTARDTKASRPVRPTRNMKSDRPTRPTRSERPQRSTTFNDEEDVEAENFVEDQDFGSVDFEGELLEENTDFEGFEEGFGAENFGEEDFREEDFEQEEFEVYPDEDYEDFTTTNNEEDFEDDSESMEYDEEETVPIRRERPKRFSRAKRDDYENEEEEEEEKVQVRHRRVREQDVVEDTPQMFSFSSDINRMTVNTMLEDVRVDDYDFDDEGNLIKKDDTSNEESKDSNNMQAVESLEDLLNGLSDSVIIDEDNEISNEIDKKISKDINVEYERTDSKKKEELHNELAEELENLQGNIVVKLQDEEQNAEITEESSESVEDTTNLEGSTEDQDIKEQLEDYKEDDDVEKGSLLERMQKIAFKYKENILNNEVESLSDIVIKYFYDGDYCAIPSNRNSLSMPNCKVYKNGRAEKWTKAQEVKLNAGDRISVDFGLSIGLPKGYGLKAVYSEDLLIKFGLDPVEPVKVFNNMEAATSLSLSFIARNAMSYVARYQPLVELEVVKVNEGI